MKLHYFRHQNEGIVHQFPFTHPPTEAQTAAIKKELESRHGTHTRPKKLFTRPSGEEVWSEPEPLFLRVVTVDVLGPDDMPQFAPPPTSTANSSGKFDVAVPEVKGVATMTPPTEGESSR